ncbi:MAG: GTPase HflX, partial [Clostridia bacterium]|nr:GTPase HflX [Clostridia bacterium]
MGKVVGETGSLNSQVKLELEKIYDLKVSNEQVVSKELLETMINISSRINREIAVYIDRKGNIQLVAVGQKEHANIPTIWLKRGFQGFSGVRCIHTHPNGNPDFSNADLSALIKLKLDAIVSIGIGDNILSSLAYLVPMEGQLKDQYQIRPNLTLSHLLNLNFSDLIMNLEKNLKFKGHIMDSKKERVLLVVIDWQNIPDEINDIVDELKNLAYTAGLEVIDVFLQRRTKKDPAFLIGKGKLHELALLIQEKQIDCVIFEDSLTPSQQNNLMQFLGVKVLDRTNLILDIFAHRANSKEGQLQVELAQLTYLLPRLSGQGTA